MGQHHELTLTLGLQNAISDTQTTALNGWFSDQHTYLALDSHQSDAISFYFDKKSLTIPSTTSALNAFSINSIRNSFAPSNPFTYAL